MTCFKGVFVCFEKNQSCVIAYAYLSYFCITNGLMSIKNLEKKTYI
jgi:hypothetical protein